MYFQAEPTIRSIASVNDATSVNDNQQRRAARQRYQAQYRALYDRLLEILFQLDPIGVHQDGADRFVPELATMLPRLREARIADDAEQIVLEELRRCMAADGWPTWIQTDLPTRQSPSARPGTTFSNRQLDRNASMIPSRLRLLLANRRAGSRS